MTFLAFRFSSGFTVSLLYRSLCERVCARTPLAQPLDKRSRQRGSFHSLEPNPPALPSTKVHRRVDARYRPIPEIDIWCRLTDVRSVFGEI
jgi:hypothetical protein